MTPPPSPLGAPETKPLAPVEVDMVALGCGRCGGSVPVADQDSVTCPYCGELASVPPEHRNAVRLVRAQDAELRHAEEEWSRFQHKALSTWVATLFEILPSLILAGSLTAALLAKFGVIVLSRSPRAFFGLTGLLPLAPAVALASLGYWSNTTADGIHVARLSLAARAGKVPGCRNCGAPLLAPEGALFVRCPYCRTDSLLTLDAVQARALVENINRAEASAQAAIESARARRAKAIWAAKWMAVIWLGMISVVLVWAFVPALDAVVGLVAAVMLPLGTYTYLMSGAALVAVIEGPGRNSQLWGVCALGSFALAVGSVVAVFVIA